MIQKVKLFTLVLLSLYLSACVAPQKNSYIKFAEVGNLYASNLSTLVSVAEKAAIDNSSVLLIEKNKRFTGESRKAENFSNDRQDEYDINTDNIEKLLVQFSNIKQHIFLISRYFSAISGYAKASESESITTAINKTADTLNALSKALLDQSLIPITEEGKASIGSITEYALNRKQRLTLKSRLAKDKEFLGQALILHSELMKALSAGMENDFTNIEAVRENIEIVHPLISKESLFSNPNYAALWMERRQNHLVTKLSQSELIQASKAAEELKKALDGLVNQDRNIFVLIDGFENEMRALKTTLSTLN